MTTSLTERERRIMLNVKRKFAMMVSPWQVDRSGFRVLRSVSIGQFISEGETLRIGGQSRSSICQGKRNARLSVRGVFSV